MSFILNMAWREMRASWHRLLFFFCIVMGVVTTLVLVTLVGALASWDVICKKPLAVLRIE